MRTILLAIALALPIAAMASVDQSSFDLHVHHGVKLKTLQQGYTTGTFQQNVDHFGHANGQTFAQRYWVDSEVARNAQAPVIFHVCGEGDVDGSYFLNDSALYWAQQLGARVVLLEHRYYGKSQPFADLSTDHLSYLTLDNAIEDLATFQRSISSTQGWQGQWISVGGSYSATLSALYRQRHPELVVGALASSAPMLSGVGQAIEDNIQDYSSTDSSDDSGARPWVYQACTSLGFWEADGPGRDANLQYPSADFCAQLFPNAPLVSSQAFNQTYDAPFIAANPQAPSNILFTYGSDDVWTNIGLATQTNLNANITVLMIDGAGHHFDLNAPDSSDTAAVIAARAQFLSLAKKWLGI